MARHGHGGSIVNIASILGWQTTGHLAPYAASKAALLHLTHSLAFELARHKIRVNAIAPGYIETEINQEFLRGKQGQEALVRVPMRRYGISADLDGALLLLASEAGSYITGAVIPVDGGHAVTGIGA